MENLTTQMAGVPLNHYIYLCAIIFTIGVIGVLTRRNAIVIFMSVELMLNAVNLLLTAFSVHSNDPSGQVFVFFIGACCCRGCSRFGNYRNGLQKYKIDRY